MLHLSKYFVFLLSLLLVACDKRAAVEFITTNENLDVLEDAYQNYEPESDRQRTSTEVQERSNRCSPLTEGGYTKNSETVSVLGSEVIKNPLQDLLQNRAAGLPDDSSTPSIGLCAGEVAKILDGLQVSTSQANVQTTPVAASGGFVYTANIEHGPDGDTNDINLRTVIRQGKRSDAGVWEWSSHVVEGRTLRDRWHTSPSVAVDKQGFIHIVYNMHNLPWQYKRSVNPHDITEWEFHGHEITISQLENFRYHNRINFPTHGIGQIPGNQITYPAFFYDNDNQLYLSYRFAARPARVFSERTFSSGIARYDVETRSWESIGEEIQNRSSDFESDQKSLNKATAVAGEMGWTAYHPRLTFGPNNELGFFHYWRDGGAGTQLTRPCYIREDGNGGFETLQGSAVALPAKSYDCGNMGFRDDEEFFGTGSVASHPSGLVNVLLSPVGSKPRTILSYSNETREWEREQAPGNASEIFYDSAGNLWAVASDSFRLYRKAVNDTVWHMVYEDGSRRECLPKARLNASQSVAFIHTQSCDLTSVSVYGLQLVDPY